MRRCGARVNTGLNVSLSPSPLGYVGHKLRLGFNQAFLTGMVGGTVTSGIILEAVAGYGVAAAGAAATAHGAMNAQDG